MRKIVLRVEDDMDPSEIYATSYQMRNFYRQFSDGFYSSLDVMNYIQHQVAVDMMSKGDRVLDVCCGRGLLLPLIRYYKAGISEYVGVDIHEPNIREQTRRSGAKEIKGLDHYPFPITHVICSCEDMDQELEHGSFDLIVYTSAIEHMQKEVGARSLENCFNLLKPSGKMFLTCPNTREKKDPYDTQYKAHLYEWDLDELREAVEEEGFCVLDTFGLVGKVREFEEFVATLPDEEVKRYFRLKEYLPSKWLMAFFPILYPEAAAEVALVLGKKKRRRRSFGL